MTEIDRLKAATLRIDPFFLLLSTREIYDAANALETNAEYNAEPSRLSPLSKEEEPRLD